MIKDDLTTLKSENDRLKKEIEELKKENKRLKSQMVLDAIEEWLTDEDN